MQGSKFDGGLLHLVMLQMWGAFLTSITLGLAYPWAMCMVYRWETNHTIIDGRRLRFDGTALGLWGSWIKWFLLTIITFGIYGFWLNIKLHDWKTSHTHFA